MNALWASVANGMPKKYVKRTKLKQEGNQNMKLASRPWPTIAKQTSAQASDRKREIPPSLRIETLPTISKALIPLLIIATAGHWVASAAQPSGLRINEVMAANVSVSPDNADFDDYSDWIELYNPTASPITLDGYYLTDDLASPVKWPFPTGASIPADGYLLIRADGFDAGPGQTFVREFSPWASFTTKRYHTNFKLAAAGESVGLYHFDGTIQPVTLLPLGSTWTYLDKGTDPGTAWFEPTFDDSSWSNGVAQLGYGDGDEQTVISYGGNSSAKYPAYYFRSTFVVDDPAALTQYQLRLLADDGAIVYLNGTEVLRVRMPEGSVDYRTYALSVATEGGYDPASISPARLQAGVNTLAVEVHQRSGTSSDVSFDLELTAKSLTGSATEVDSVTFGRQYPNVSWARNPSDDGNWTYFGEPTAGGPNVTVPAAEPIPSAPVEFSIANGFYDSPQDVALSTTALGATIHYTLDGSVPGSSSPAYVDPIPIAATTVVRARSFEPGMLPGPVETKTFFVNEPERPLPVVSFVVQPTEFFDATLGIYTNIYKGREAAVHLEYFDADRNLGFAVNAGTKIAGENIWRFAQKPLTVTLRGKYGSDTIDYQIFPTERVGSFTQLVLRNGGDNWPNAMLRDAMTPFILRGQSPADVQNYRPCVVYMNGQYWGIQNVREKLDTGYFATHHHINAGTYDYLEYAHVLGNVVGLVPDEGDADAYNSIVDFATTNDLTVAENFQQLAAQIDLDSFFDFLAAEDYVVNTSWPWNREFWRERRPDAKLRFVVPDLDRGFNSANVTSSLLDNMLLDYPLFKRLAANPDFRNQFAQRYAAHLASTFHPQRIADIVDQLDAEVLPEIPRHIARWAADGGIQSLASRQAELDEIKQFAVDRATYVRAGISNYLGISATANLTVNVSPPGAGSVRLAGVPLLAQYSSTATMYRDIPLDVGIVAAPGYEFAGWSDGLGTDPKISLTLSADRTLTANFVVSPEHLIPTLVSSDLTLTAADSPYTSEGSVTVAPGVTLTVEAGVAIRFPRLADLTIKGALIINGNDSAPVTIEPRDSSTKWGVISFVDATGSSQLSHLTIRGASIGAEPVNSKSAISNLRSTVEIDHADIESDATIFARGGSTILRSSRIYSPYTGDGINIKQGAGLVEDSVFVGNDAPDTDAIDFDGVVNGVIRRNRILAFRGFNSDGIDIGEGCVNLLISSNLIYNSWDKGISVGQGSKVRAERNLIVGCTLGIGIKDTGSQAIIDQNTFANNSVGVAVFEKNLGAGGGDAIISNSIFSRSKQAPVTVDSLSTASVIYSLSDTLPIAGTGNFVADPLFRDAAAYDFSLQTGSPAIDAGDPGHAPDSDLSPADIGAYYSFSPDDYPYHPPNLVVINEVLAHSHDLAPDWIELFNSSEAPVDISGWYLSDSKTALQKYRIADGTILPGHGYLVLYEDTNFGAGSADAGSITPFALSENGESVFLFAPGDGLYLDYLEEEAFGASSTDVSQGRYFKSSSNTYNFVAMAAQTPGQANSLPLVGPISISEIMYHPPVNPDAEYIELVNISSEPVVLFDNTTDVPWRFTDGIDFGFPSNPPVTMAPGERILVVRNLTAFDATYTVPTGTQLFQWTAGGLDNKGEKVELSKPGDLDANLVRQFIRVDRVNFNDKNLWPVNADGLGSSLTRLDEKSYGNDVANWVAAGPTPGSAYLPVFSQWAIDQNLPADQSGPTADPDLDGLPNLLEYIYGTSPTFANLPPAPGISSTSTGIDITIPIARGLTGVVFDLQQTDTLAPANWQLGPSFTIEPTAAGQLIHAQVPVNAPELFFRLKVDLAN